MIVVKLGGSLYRSKELAPCLHALKQLSQQQPIIIVPGGGPFADQVRQAQQAYQFNDSFAHHMAILAMTQFGLVIHSLEPSCETFSTPVEQRANASPLSIWLPNEALLSEKNLAQNWNITSDSLALWLAQQLHADQLILIKYQSHSSYRSITQLSQEEVIDQGFPNLYQQSPIPTQVLSVKDILNSNSITLAQPLSL